MATSRTGTSKWRHIRARALHNAKAQSLTRCPICQVKLDYQVSRQPNSAEVDHIIPHAISNTDSIETVRVICRKCNQSLGGRLGNQRRNGTTRQNVETITF